MSCCCVSVAPDSMLRFTLDRVARFGCSYHFFSIRFPRVSRTSNTKLGSTLVIPLMLSPSSSLSVEWLVILTTTHTSEPALTLGASALIAIVSGCSVPFCAASGTQLRSSNKQARFTGPPSWRLDSVLIPTDSGQTFSCPYHF